jgi:hypothetical protein
MHRRQRQDLGPLHLSQFGGHDTADSGSNRLAGLVDEDAGIVVELDHAPVWPLPLLRCAHYHGMSYIASTDLVRCADGNAVAGLGAKVALLLDDYHYAIAYRLLTTVTPRDPPVHRPHTDFGGSLRSQDIDALDYGGARIVDAVDEGLDCDA